MRRAPRCIVVLAAIALSRAAAAGPAQPLRVALECESSGRTKACPEFLRGLINRLPVLLDSPRSDAQVVLYVATTEVVLQDRVHLRFVGTVLGAPPTIEVDAELDTRATDDAQIAQLEPVFLRGIALYIAAVHPSAVAVTVTVPGADAVANPRTTPWGVAFTTSGSGSWTRRYKSLDAEGSVVVSRTDATSVLAVEVVASGGLTRQPSLDVMGNVVRLDTTRWSLAGEIFIEHHLTRSLAVGGASSLRFEDPKGQYRSVWQNGMGIEWDRFASNDPRGNVLAIAYLFGYQVDRYNFPAEVRSGHLGRFAHYPVNKLAAAGRIRRDRISYGLSLAIDSEILHPLRRHSISGSPSIEIKIGAHVDLKLSMSLTKRELPEPMIPPDDYEAISRGDYAEPFSASGSVTISIHWDRTNAVQNNRFQEF